MISRDYVEMASLKDKLCLITGANSGMGRAVTLQLANMGARIVMTCRDETKGENALSEIKRRSGNENIELMIADLSSLASVRKLANEFIDKSEKLHVLINNAGLVNLRRHLTEDGYEATFEINYLAPFLLTSLLLPLLKSSNPSRIVNVSSVAHYGGHIDFADLQSENNYGGMKAYAQSKLALVLFTRQLAKKLKGTGVTTYSLHPGAVATNIWSRPAGSARFIMAIPKLFMRSPEKGAETVVYLASAEGIEDYSGEYFEDRKVKKSSRESYVEQTSEKLWNVSTELVHLSSTDVIIQS